MTSPSQSPDTALLGATLRTLQKELHRDIELLRDEQAPILGLEPDAETLDVLTQDLESQLERVSSAAVITIVGATGAGKSTLLNALVGYDIATPGSSRPTTTRPVIYKPRDVDTSDLVDGLGDYTPVIETYQESGGLFTEQVIIDAPDTNSTSTEHHAIVRALAERSDVLIVVAHRQSVAELATIDFVDSFAGRRDLILVLNRTDELTDVSRDKLMDQLRTLANQRWASSTGEAPPVIATSAQNRLHGGDDTGMADLELALTELVSSGRLGMVRRHNALGTLEKISALARGWQDELGPKLKVLTGLGEAALAEYRARVERELEQRLELRRSDLKHLLWQETSRNWDGPGGWALRTGGLAGLGIGAGAAVVRRNPLLAAGTAVSALALDRANGALRERRVERKSGLVPSEVELDGWYREDFSAARLQGLELTGNSLAFGLADSMSATDRATGAIESAWARLLERDLRRAATRGARWYLRWPVDLPVFALCGWVVWQAALGLFGGFTDMEASGAGTSLLINAALVLVAWLFLARGAIRMLLSGLVSGLLTSVRHNATTELVRMQDELGARQREAIAARMESLEHLATAPERWRTRLGIQ